MASTLSNDSENEWCECFELQENPLYENPDSEFRLFKWFIKVFDGLFTIWSEDEVEHCKI